VPEAARELSRRRLVRAAGADFARLTGDFNPIHWLGSYAKAVGFRDVILHGFASFALTFEALVGRVFSGDACRLSRLDANFTRPLVLPAQVGVYISGDRVYLGDALGGAAYLSGEFGAGG
jgi:acyl dehydratase